jgi:hypothetical protein
MTLCRSISTKASSSSCLNFFLNKYFSFDRAFIYLVHAVLVYLLLIHLFALLFDPFLSRLVSCASSICFHLSSQLSGSELGLQLVATHCCCVLGVETLDCGMSQLLWRLKHSSKTSCSSPVVFCMKRKQRQRQNYE